MEIDDETWSMRYYDKIAGSANEICGHYWQPLDRPTSIRPAHLPAVFAEQPTGTATVG